MYEYIVKDIIKIHQEAVENNIPESISYWEIIKLLREYDLID